MDQPDGDYTWDAINILLNEFEMPELDDMFYWDLGSVQRNFLKGYDTNETEKAQKTSDEEAGLNAIDTLGVYGETAEKAAENAVDSTPTAPGSSATHAAIQNVKSEEKTIRLKCDQCEATFASKASLSRQTNISHGTGTCKYTCPQCDRRFRCKIGLDTHIKREHQGIEPKHKWHCKTCGASYLHKQMLEKHMRVIHSEGSGQFRCTECKLECYSGRGLQDHINAVHRNVKHVCEACGKSLNYDSSLSRHKRQKVQCRNASNAN